MYLLLLLGMGPTTIIGVDLDSTSLDAVPERPEVWIARYEALVREGMAAGARQVELEDAGLEATAGQAEACYRRALTLLRRIRARFPYYEPARLMADELYLRDHLGEGNLARSYGILTARYPGTAEAMEAHIWLADHALDERQVHIERARDDTEVGLLPRAAGEHAEAAALLQTAEGHLWSAAATSDPEQVAKTYGNLALIERLHGGDGLLATRDGLGRLARLGADAHSVNILLAEFAFGLAASGGAAEVEPELERWAERLGDADFSRRTFMAMAHAHRGDRDALDLDRDVGASSCGEPCARLVLARTLERWPDHDDAAEVAGQILDIDADTPATTRSAVAVFAAGWSPRTPWGAAHPGASRSAERYLRDVVTRTYNIAERQIYAGDDVQSVDETVRAALRAAAEGAETYIAEWPEAEKGLDVAWVAARAWGHLEDHALAMSAWSRLAGELPAGSEDRRGARREVVRHGMALAGFSADIVAPTAFIEADERLVQAIDVFLVENPQDPDGIALREVLAVHLLNRGQWARAEGAVRTILQALVDCQANCVKTDRSGVKAVGWLPLAFEARGDAPGLYRAADALKKVHTTGETAAALTKLWHAAGYQALVERETLVDAPPERWILAAAAWGAYAKEHEGAPLRHTAWEQAARAWFNAGRLGSSVECRTGAIAAAPDEAFRTDQLRRRGDAYERQLLWSEAVADYLASGGAARSEEEAQGLLRVVSIAEVGGDVAAAAQASRTLLRSRPSARTTWLAVLATSRLYLQRGEVETARSFLRRLPATRPPDGGLDLQVSAAFIEVAVVADSDIRLAEAMFERASRIVAENVIALASTEDWRKDAGIAVFTLADRLREELVQPLGDAAFARAWGRASAPLLAVHVLGPVDAAVAAERRVALNGDVVVRLSTARTPPELTGDQLAIFEELRDDSVQEFDLASLDLATDIHRFAQAGDLWVPEVAWAVSYAERPALLQESPACPDPVVAGAGAVAADLLNRWRQPEALLVARDHLPDEALRSAAEWTVFGDAELSFDSGAAIRAWNAGLTLAPGDRGLRCRLGIAAVRAGDLSDGARLLEGVEGLALLRAAALAAGGDEAALATIVKKAAEGDRTAEWMAAQVLAARPEDALRSVAFLEPRVGARPELEPLLARARRQAEEQRSVVRSAPPDVDALVVRIKGLLVLPAAESYRQTLEACLVNLSADPPTEAEECAAYVDEISKLIKDET